MAQSPQVSSSMQLQFVWGNPNEPSKWPIIAEALMFDDMVRIGVLQKFETP
jgi:hypothetical protein